MELDDLLADAKKALADGLYLEVTGDALAMVVKALEKLKDSQE